MRVLSFGFKMSSSGKGRTIAASLLHHAFPKRHFLLFAYEFKEPYYSTVGDVNMFQRYNDWKREMDRTNCQKSAPLRQCVFYIIEHFLYRNLFFV